MTHTPSQSDGSMTIGDLAKAAGVNVETIRFYQRKGLMPEPDRPVGSIRCYGRTDQSRLSFIKSAKRLGFRPRNCFNWRTGRVVPKLGGKRSLSWQKSGSS